MKKRSLSKFGFGLIAGIFLLQASVCPPGMAQERDTVKIYVMISLAVPGGEKVDPRLGEIHQELKNTFRESSYELLDEVRFDLTLQEQDGKPLPGDAHLYIQYMGMDGGKVNLNLKITQKGSEVLNTNFSISKGGTIIVGGPPYKDGNLVLAVKTAMN